MTAGQTYTVVVSTTITDLAENALDGDHKSAVYATVTYGDVSGNGSVNAYDASLAAQYGVGLIVLGADKIIAADVSGNGTVNAYDASLIAQKGVGLIDTFPVEQ